MVSRFAAVYISAVHIYIYMHYTSLRKRRRPHVNKNKQPFDIIYTFSGASGPGKKFSRPHADGTAAASSVLSLKRSQSRWHRDVKLFAKGVDIDAQEIPRRPLIIHGPRTPLLIFHP